MRHTRKRQMYLLTNHTHWKKTYNIPISEYRKWARGLDSTFQWIRINYEDNPKRIYNYYTIGESMRTRKTK